MSKLIRWGHRKLAGFSLLELMVVVAILGVLATVAIPRFNIFRARARQSEAKTNLGVIFTLQEAFSIEHERYYNGQVSDWGGTEMSDNANRDGYFASGSGKCAAADANNKLGFRLANCEKARYGYYIPGAGENNFVAIAYAPSDTVGDKRIFPGCAGDQPATSLHPETTGAALIQGKCVVAGADDYTAVRATHADGDAWCMEAARNLFNYRDITEFCEN